MNLPFTTDHFLRIFSDYNQAVWPAQVLWNACALIAIILVIWRKRFSGQGISLILGLLWIWMGVVYHWLFFSSINKAAIVFGALFVVQGLLCVWVRVFQNRLSFNRPKGIPGIAGGILVVYALLAYPLIGNTLGHAYPHSPTFGLPCPTTIFSLGILLWMNRRPSLYLIAIPLLWSIIGFLAALQLGIREDVGLLVAGLVMATWFVTERSAPKVVNG